MRDPRPWIGAALATWVIAMAAGLDGDANWDLRNYHLYDPFALFDPATASDVAPAQIQTYHPPTIDIPYHWLVRHLRTVRSLNVALAVPHAGVAVIGFLITARVLRSSNLVGFVLAGLAAAFGISGAASLPTLATTMDDSVPVFCVLTALLLLLSDREWTARRCLAAGLLCGGAVGLKLTTAYAGAGLGCALLIAGGGRPADRVVRGTAFAAGAVAGALATGGWWWWRLYAETGNPVFPYLNGLFHSPLLPATNIYDTRFFPKDLLEWAAYPFSWAVTPFLGPAELPVRDPRFALATVATVVLGIAAVWRRDRRSTMLAVFMAVSYLLWLRQFAILRYLSCLEPLTGTVIVAALQPLLRTNGARLAAVAAGAMLLAGIDRITLYPDWGRTPRCTRWPDCPPIAVTFPPIGENSLVVLLDQGPMAYLRPFAPRSSRWVGAHGSLVELNREQPMQKRVQAALDAQDKELWGLEETNSQDAGSADRTLAFYGLRRDGCERVRSNLDYDGIQLCRLKRN